VLTHYYREELIWHLRTDTIPQCFLSYRISVASAVLSAANRKTVYLTWRRVVIPPASCKLVPFCETARRLTLEGRDLYKVLISNWCINLSFYSHSSSCFHLCLFCAFVLSSLLRQHPSLLPLFRAYFFLCFLPGCYYNLLSVYNLFTFYNKLQANVTYDRR
jgi:hypothetical protein